MGRDRHDRRHKRSHRSTSPERVDDEEKHLRKTTAQQGLDAAKARLRDKLSTAIIDLRDPKYSASSGEVVDYHRMQTLNLSASEYKTRQEAIDSIETSGFSPAAFHSTRGGSSSHNLSKPSAALNDHEKAMFGAQWQSKALQKDLKTDEKTEDDVIEIKAEPAFSLAHPRFSEDPKIREERWLKLFKERRKEFLTS